MALINDVYVFVKSENVTRGNEASTHPVEEGIDLTDNVRRSPASLSLSGEIVGTDYEDDVSQIDSMMCQGELVEYVGVSVLSDLIITQFDTSSDGTIRGGCNFTMDLKEIRIASSPYAAGSVNSGEQQVEQGSPAETSQVQVRTHEVKQGDTLWKLSASYYGNGALFPQIFEANRDKLSNPDRIVNGQVLVIP